MSDGFEFIPAALPFAPRPASDELISSWLSRVSQANGLSVAKLIASMRARDQHLRAFPASFDYRIPIRWRKQIATFCRVPEKWVWALDLQQQFPGRGFEWFAHAEVVAASLLGLTSRHLRLPFCAACCKEQCTQRKPVYIRAEWGLAFNTHCSKHLMPLIDHCAACGEVTFPRSSSDELFRCSDCDAVLRPTHVLAGSPGLRIVVRLQQTISECLRSRPPDLFWLGPIKAADFLYLIWELIDLLAIRVPESPMVLADLLVPDEFSLRYRIGGRFLRPRLPVLPWFPRFLLLAALTRILLGGRSSDYFDSDAGRHVNLTGRTVGTSLVSLPEGLRYSISKRVETWPEPLRTTIEMGIRANRTRPSFVRRLSAVSNRSRDRYSGF